MRLSRDAGRGVLLYAVAALIAFGMVVAPAQAITLPAGFDDQLVDDADAPTDLAFTPDGRMLVTSQFGGLNVIQNGSRLPNAAINLAGRLCTNGERGLLGVAVDPSFGLNRYVYLFYTFKKSTGCPQNDDVTGASTSSPVNRVSRFILSDANTVSAASETVLIDNIPSPHLYHNAGDLGFGADGMLYVSTGDGSCDYRGNSGCGGDNDAARDQNVLLGKVLRIAPDGSIPLGNPFQGSDADRCNIAGQTTIGRRCKETFSWGLRNPYRFAFDEDAAGTRAFVNDVGQDTWEEVDLLQPGADYGWNVREGPCAEGSTSNCGAPPAGMTNPVHSYRSTDCASVTGAAFVPNGIWPSQYDQSYLYSDYVCGDIFKLDPNGSGGYVASVFASDAGAAVAMTFGPHGSGTALYYLDYGSEEVRRIAYTGVANRSPTARATATPISGGPPLTVNFNGAGSSDPDSDPLTYQWSFGDGSADAAGVSVGHTYNTAGTYTATLTARDGRGGVDTDTVRIDVGNRAPAPTITSPAAGKLFKVGEQLTLTGSATDPDEGQLGAGALRWRVLRHHDTHTHPYLAPTTGNNIQFAAPGPEDLGATTNSYLEVELTATDSRGLSTTVRRNVNPRTVAVTFNTAPAGGLKLNVADATITAPATITSWDGWSFTVAAPAQTDSRGVSWRYGYWSDGAHGASRTITTPSTPASYTATFLSSYPRPGSGTPLRIPLVPGYAACTAPNSSHAAPLSYPSCSPPAQESPLLTISSVGRGSGFANLRALVGNPSTPADEADVALHAYMSDVKRTATGADYTGDVLLRWNPRITDSGNGPDGDDPATAFTGDLAFPVRCLATSNPNVGSTCQLNSTLDSLVPGLAVEQRRTIMRIPIIRVLDAGSDGTVVPSGGGCPPTCGTGDESPFLRQGLFLP